MMDEAMKRYGEGEAMYIAKWKKPVLKGYILYGSKHMTF